MQQKLYIAIPLLNELENLDSIFRNLQKQSTKNFTLLLCVNQPDNWWDDKDKVSICENNAKSIEYINAKVQQVDFPIILIDKSSKGKGWTEKKLGVGWARKTLMDYIAEIANDEDITISLDADTIFRPQYFSNIVKFFDKNKNFDLVSVPYFHPLSIDKNASRAMLRYEIYMRQYFLNLIRIKSPYAFSALGSAIAFRQKGIKKIGGFTPKKSGEDFYFLQKMIKYKPISNWVNDTVYPAARFSDRVAFGTGPAMIKGNNGDWDSYPNYPSSLFDNIKGFYDLIPQLYSQNVETPIDSFWENDEKKDAIFQKLRNNNKDLKHFTKAVHDYFDGLRTLQYLKSTYTPTNEEENLIDFLKSGFASGINEGLLQDLSFENSTLGQLDAIRDYLYKLEDIKRQQITFE